MMAQPFPHLSHLFPCSVALGKQAQTPAQAVKYMGKYAAQYAADKVGHPPPPRPHPAPTFRLHYTTWELPKTLRRS